MSRTRYLQLALAVAIGVTVVVVVLVNTLGGGEPLQLEPTTVASASPTVERVTPTASPLPSPTPTPAPTRTPAPTPTPSPPDAAGQAIAMLIAENGFSPDDLQVESYERIEWPNMALDCPEAGVVYTPERVSGWKIVIRHTDGRQFEIHSSDTNEELVNCTQRMAAAQNSVNPAQAAGLSATTRIDISRLNFTTSVYDPVAVIEDSAEVQTFVDTFDVQMSFADPTPCDPIFSLTFRLPDANQTFGYMCREDLSLIRGNQRFWAGNDGRAPDALGDLVGPYVSAVPLPGLPPD